MSELVSVGCFTLYQQLGTKPGLDFYSVFDDRIYDMRCIFVVVGLNALLRLDYGGLGPIQ